MKNSIARLINRIRPTAILIALALVALAIILVVFDRDYAEAIVGAIVGALAGGFSQLTQDSPDTTVPTEIATPEQPTG